MEQGRWQQTDQLTSDFRIKTILGYNLYMIRNGNASVLISEALRNANCLKIRLETAFLIGHFPYDGWGDGVICSYMMR